jgi:chromosome segregation ATPase
VATLVFVGRRATDDSVAVVSGPDGLSLAEELQDRLRRAEVEAVRARSDADARGERVRELEEALRARLAELDDLHGELAHARMDLELKDAYSLEMRTLADDREMQAHLTRLEAQALQRSVDHLQASLLEAHALLAGRTGELAVAKVDIDRLATELDAVTHRASYQIVDGTTKALERFRPAARLAGGIARRLARLAGRGRGPTPGA